MIHDILERQQTSRGRQMRWLRAGMVVLTANMAALLATQRYGLALLIPYLNHVPAWMSSYHQAMLACGGMSLPC